MKKLITIAAGALMLLMGTSAAWAIPTLSLSTVGKAVTVNDEGPGDAYPETGVVTFMGPVGNWKINVSTGISPFGPGVPYMDLNSVNTTLVNGAADLVIKFSDRIAAPWTGPGAVAVVGGTITPSANNWISFDLLINGHSQGAMTFNGTGDGKFSGSNHFNYTPSADGDLIELVATLHNPTKGGSSFDFSLTPVPEPGTMMLLGAGFLGLAIYGKRRRNG